MLRTTFLIALIGVTVGVWKPDPPPELPTDEEVFDSNPIVVEAKKMQKLAPSQNVIMTCRYLLFKVPMNYTDARDYCNQLETPLTSKGRGIDLATVQNTAENNDLKSLLRIAFGIKFDNSKPYKFGNWVFIGLTKRVDNDRKLSKKEKGEWNAEHWFYENRGMARYHNFRKEMPDQQRQGNKKKGYEYQNVVQVNKKGYWDDTFASKSLPFACQYCGKYIVLSKHVTWYKAKQHCEDVGLTFATVESEQENRELLFAAEIALGDTIYGKRFNNSNWVWIGEKEQMGEDGKGNGVWTHHDDSELPYSPAWDYKRQPDNWVLPRGEQSVVAISRKNGKWDDSFPFKKRPFACMCAERACKFA